LDQPELMRRLICAALKEGSPTAKYEPAGWNRNRVQDEMVAILKRAIASQQIALLEGSTGIGKSRVIARTVIEHGSKKKDWRVRTNSPGGLSSGESTAGRVCNRH
jgi:MoxR-like ATPase